MQAPEILSTGVNWLNKITGVVEHFIKSRMKIMQIWKVIGYESISAITLGLTDVKTLKENLTA